MLRVIPFVPCVKVVPEAASLVSPDVPPVTKKSSALIPLFSVGNRFIVVVGLCEGVNVTVPVAVSLLLAIDCRLLIKIELSTL